MSAATKHLVGEIHALLRTDLTVRIHLAFPSGQWLGPGYRIAHPTDAGLRYVVFPDLHWELQKNAGEVVTRAGGEPILGHNFALLYKRVHGALDEAAAARALAGKLGITVEKKVERKVERKVEKKVEKKKPSKKRSKE